MEGRSSKLGADFLERVEAVERSEGRAKKEAKDPEISLPSFRLHRVEYGRQVSPGQKVINRPTNPGRKADKWTESGMLLDFFKFPGRIQILKPPVLPVASEQNL